MSDQQKFDEFFGTIAEALPPVPPSVPAPSPTWSPTSFIGSVSSPSESVPVLSPIAPPNLLTPYPTRRPTEQPTRSPMFPTISPWPTIAREEYTDPDPAAIFGSVGFILAIGIFSCICMSGCLIGCMNYCRPVGTEGLRIQNAYEAGLERARRRPATNTTVDTELGGGDDLPEASPLALKASRIAHMDFHERFALYSEAFDRNRNQMVLDGPSTTPIVSTHLGTVTEHDDDSCCYHENDDESKIIDEDSASIRQAVLLARSIRHDDPLLTPRQSREKSTIVHPRSRNGGVNEEANGSCVICLEKFEIGDTLVWSETKSCPHVFRKDCLVAFFAHLKLKEEKILKDENPCPICRQKFVSVIY